MNVYVGNRLPITYQEVEYIQSSGTQYIDTGYIPSNNTKLVMSMGGWLPSVIDYGDVFGARYSWSSDASVGRGFQLSYRKSVGSYQNMFGRNYEPSGLGFSDGNNHIIDISQNGLYIDATLKQSYSTVTFTSPVTLKIFAMDTNGVTDGFALYKLYSLKIYENGTLVRDFIPCYRKSDNVIGLYDLVNNQFYTNSGSGTFSKGSDVLTLAELKNAYIGEYIEETINIVYNQIHRIHKDGYSISKIVLQGSINSSSAEQYYLKVFSSRGAEDANNTDYGFTLFTGSLRTTNQYGYVFRDKPSKTIIKYFPSSATSSSKSACRLTIEPTHAKVEVGQTLGNWLYTESLTYSEQDLINITKIFNSNLSLVQNFGNALSNCQAIISYVSN